MTPAPPSASEWAAAQLNELEANDLRRRPLVVTSPPGPETGIDGRTVLSLCSNNYLGLAGHSRVQQAAANAALEWGAGAGASRLVSGSMSIHRELESKLAGLKGCEDAMLFSSGYLANIGAISALVGPGDAVFSDRLNHASIVDGCRLSRAEVRVYEHNNLDQLADLLDSSASARRLIVTDTIFSMDGDLARLTKLREIAKSNGAMLMVDEAHATGLLGPDGGGALEAAGLSGKADLVMGTLSKAIGASGGFIAGTRHVVELVRNRARTYIFDTALAPSSAGAAIEALEIMRTEPQRRSAALGHAKRLAAGLTALGYKVVSPAAAIIPLHVGESKAAVELSNELLDLGVMAPAIRPPTVAPGTARLRLTVMATHTQEHIDRALSAFERLSGENSGARKRSSESVPNGARDARRLRAIRDARSSRVESSIDPRVVAAGGVFVTGTDTGVGKTFVAAELARMWGTQGLRVAALKPVQTGTDTGDDDLRLIGERGRISPELLACPYSFPDALAPQVAAEGIGAKICLEPIRESFNDLRSKADLVIVEGSGGLLVPLAENLTMADLAGRLRIPIIVVATAALGTLNHTALTLASAAQHGLTILGVVVNKFPRRPDIAERTNPEAMEKLLKATVIGILPDDNKIDEDPAQFFAPRLGGRFAREDFAASRGVH
ncbi:MAG: 8-amino-7-oxononanoate synthase [Actinomycetota bacterium]